MGMKNDINGGCMLICLIFAALIGMAECNFGVGVVVFLILLVIGKATNVIR